jgi:hypothetical protein
VLAACAAAGLFGGLIMAGWLVRAGFDTGWGRLGSLILGVPLVSLVSGAVGSIIGFAAQVWHVGRQPVMEREGYHLRYALLPGLAGFVVAVLVGLVGGAIVESLPGGGGC